MYTRCFICRRSLGENSVVPHLTIGRRLAFDVERGRLWVVCVHCGQWCLTPMEDRWEAIGECEALFTEASARVAAGTVGLARAPGVELIRIGSAMRDEIANWRYGPRLARRRRRIKIASGALAVGGGGLTAAFLYGLISLAVSTGSAAAGVWLGLIGAMYASKIPGISGWTPIARAWLPDGSHRLLRRADLPAIYMGRGTTHAALQIAFDDLTAAYSGDDALTLLSRILPHANWRGADATEIRAATVRLDHAERASGRHGHGRIEAWEYLAEAGRTAQALPMMSTVDRLALEMAVNEALEHRSMAGEAALLAQQWPVEEEIAHTADDMFLPAWITDRLRAAKRQFGAR